MEFGLQYANHNHHAEVTSAGARVAYNANGSCTAHPDILLRKKKTFGFGWKILLHECPRCKADWEDKRLQQQKPYKPTKKPAAQAVEPTEEDPSDDEEEVVYTPTPKKKPVPTQKPARSPAPAPTERQRLRPPPVNPMVEVVAPVEMQVAAVNGDIGQLVAIMRQYLGSAKLAGVGCELLWQFSNIPQNVPILKHHAMSVVDDAVYFYQHHEDKVGYFGPLLLDRLAEN